MTTTKISDRCTFLQPLACAAALAVPLLAGAHDLVLVPEPGGNLTVRFGHPGDWQTIDKERLLEPKVEGEAGIGSGAGPALALVGKGMTLVAPGVAPRGQAALASARYDNGLWVTVPDAAGKPVYHNASKAMLPQATASMASVKFAKALYAAPGDAGVYKRELNHLIELLPQRNPAAVKAGDTLAVLVKFNGKPLANGGVEVTDSGTKTVEGQIKYTTDAAGIVEVPIRRGGLNVISVDHEQANDGSLGPAMKALPVDKITMIATYAFQVR